MFSSGSCIISKAIFLVLFEFVFFERIKNCKYYQVNTTTIPSNSLTSV